MQKLQVLHEKKMWIISEIVFCTDGIPSAIHKAKKLLDIKICVLSFNTHIVFSLESTSPAYLYK